MKMNKGILKDNKKIQTLDEELLLPNNYSSCNHSPNRLEDERLTKARAELMERIKNDPDLSKEMKTGMLKSAAKSSWIPGAIEPADLDEPF